MAQNNTHLFALSRVGPKAGIAWWGSLLKAEIKMPTRLSAELILIVGKMQFLVHCHPGATLSSCRSLAFLAMWPSLPQASNSGPSLSRASNLDYPSATREGSLLQRVRVGRAHLIISLSQGQLIWNFSYICKIPLLQWLDSCLNNWETVYV